MSLAPGDISLTARLHSVRDMQAERVECLTRPVFGEGHAYDMRRMKVALAHAFTAILIADQAFADRDSVTLDGALLNIKIEAQTALALASAYQKDILADRELIR